MKDILAVQQESPTPFLADAGAE